MPPMKVGSRFFHDVLVPAGQAYLFPPFPPGRRTQLYIYKKT
mgnify:CR=1 FL=1